MCRMRAFSTPHTAAIPTELGNAPQIGNLVEYFGSWASGALTPAADWVDFVSNQSQAGNTESTTIPQSKLLLTPLQVLQTFR